MKIFLILLLAANLSARSNQQQGATPNTVGLWHLNDESVTAYDNSGQGNNGTYSGTSFPDGIFDKARGFNGTSDYIIVDNESNFDFEWTDPFSISFWLKSDDSVNNFIISKGYWIASDNFHSWAVADYDSIALLLNTSTAVDNRLLMKMSTPVDDGEWHHIVTTYDGSGTEPGIKIYCDGENQVLIRHLSSAYYQITGGTILSDYPVLLGEQGQPGNYSYYNGELDEIIIRHGVISAGEVKYIFESQSEAHQ